MSDPLKYVIVNISGCELPIVFPAILDHWQVVQGMNLLSAGMLTIEPRKDKLECFPYGGSTTLGIKCRPEDKKVLDWELNRPLRD